MSDRKWWQFWKPKNPDLRASELWTEAFAMGMVGNVRGEIAIYERILNIRGVSATQQRISLLALGKARARAGDSSGAITALTQGIDLAAEAKLDPLNSLAEQDAYIERGRARFRVGDLEGARIDFERVLDGLLDLRKKESLQQEFAIIMTAIASKSGV